MLEQGKVWCLMGSYAFISAHDLSNPLSAQTQQVLHLEQTCQAPVQVRTDR